MLVGRILKNNMQTDIHPNYYKDAVIKCSCGAKYHVGSTTKEIKVEVCGACHPFYTGKQDHLIDTTGRVDKFKAKMEKAAQSAERLALRNKERKAQPHTKQARSEVKRSHKKKSA